MVKPQSNSNMSMIVASNNHVPSSITATADDNRPVTRCQNYSASSTPKEDSKLSSLLGNSNDTMTMTSCHVNVVSTIDNGNAFAVGVPSSTTTTGKKKRKHGKRKRKKQMLNDGAPANTTNHRQPPVDAPMAMDAPTSNTNTTNAKSSEGVSSVASAPRRKKKKKKKTKRDRKKNKNLHQQPLQTSDDNNNNNAIDAPASTHHIMVVAPSKPSDKPSDDGNANVHLKKKRRKVKKDTDTSNANAAVTKKSSKIIKTKSKTKKKGKKNIKSKKKAATKKNKHQSYYHKSSDSEEEEEEEEEEHNCITITGFPSNNGNSIIPLQQILDNQARHAELCRRERLHTLDEEALDYLATRMDGEDDDKEEEENTHHCIDIEEKKEEEGSVVNEICVGINDRANDRATQAMKQTDEPSSTGQNEEKNDELIISSRSSFVSFSAMKPPLGEVAAAAMNKKQEEEPSFSCSMDDPFDTTEPPITTTREDNDGHHQDNGTSVNRGGGSARADGKECVNKTSCTSEDGIETGARDKEGDASSCSGDNGLSAYNPRAPQAAQKEPSLACQGIGDKPSTTATECDEALSARSGDDVANNGNNDGSSCRNNESSEGKPVRSGDNQEYAYESDGEGSVVNSLDAQEQALLERGYKRDGDGYIKLKRPYRTKAMKAREKREHQQALLGATGMAIGNDEECCGIEGNSSGKNAAMATASETKCMKEHSGPKDEMHFAHANNLKGFHYYEDRKMYKAEIRYKGVKGYLGCYKLASDAALAYDRAMSAVQGPNYNINESNFALAQTSSAMSFVGDHKYQKCRAKESKQRTGLKVVDCEEVARYISSKVERVYAKVQSACSAANAAGMAAAAAEEKTELPPSQGTEAQKLMDHECRENVGANVKASGCLNGYSFGVDESNALKRSVESTTKNPAVAGIHASSNKTSTAEHMAKSAEEAVAESAQSTTQTTPQLIPTQTHEDVLYLVDALFNETDDKAQINTKSFYELVASNYGWEKVEKCIKALIKERLIFLISEDDNVEESMKALIQKRIITSTESEKEDVSAAEENFQKHEQAQSKAKEDEVGHASNSAQGGGNGCAGSVVTVSTTDSKKAVERGQHDSSPSSESNVSKESMNLNHGVLDHEQTISDDATNAASAAASERAEVTPEDDEVAWINSNDEPAHHTGKPSDGASQSARRTTKQSISSKQTKKSSKKAKKRSKSSKHRKKKKQSSSRPGTPTNDEVISYMDALALKLGVNDKGHVTDPSVAKSIGKSAFDHFGWDMIEEETTVLMRAKMLALSGWVDKDLASKSSQKRSQTQSKVDYPASPTTTRIVASNRMQDSLDKAPSKLPTHSHSVNATSPTHSPCQPCGCTKDVEVDQDSPGDFTISVNTTNPTHLTCLSCGCTKDDEELEVYRGDLYCQKCWKENDKRADESSIEDCASFRDEDSPCTKSRCDEDRSEENGNADECQSKGVVTEPATSNDEHSMSTSNQSSPNHNEESSPESSTNTSERSEQIHAEEDPSKLCTNNHAETSSDECSPTTARIVASIRMQDTPMLIIPPKSLDSAASSQSTHAKDQLCLTCGSTKEVEEDTDNPGDFYCRMCWEEYDEKDDEPSSEHEGSTKYQSEKQEDDEADHNDNASTSDAANNSTGEKKKTGADAAADAAGNASSSPNTSLLDDQYQEVALSTATSHNNVERTGEGGNNSTNEKEEMNVHGAEAAFGSSTTTKKADAESSGDAGNNNTIEKTVLNLDTAADTAVTPLLDSESQKVEQSTATTNQSSEQPVAGDVDTVQEQQQPADQIACSQDDRDDKGPDHNAQDTIITPDKLEVDNGQQLECQVADTRDDNTKSAVKDEATTNYPKSKESMAGDAKAESVQQKQQKSNHITNPTDDDGAEVNNEMQLESQVPDTVDNKTTTAAMQDTTTGDEKTKSAAIEDTGNDGATGTYSGTMANGRDNGKDDEEEIFNSQQKEEILRKRKINECDTTNLRKKCRISDEDVGSVWSERRGESVDIKLIARAEKTHFARLSSPTAEDHEEYGESITCAYALQAFDVKADDDDLYGGYFAGRIILRPGGLFKHFTGMDTYLITVGRCQPSSIELSVADPDHEEGEYSRETAQRFLLSEEDIFQVPAMTMFHIMNHSKDTEARLSCTTVRCTKKGKKAFEMECSGDEDFTTRQKLKD